MFKVCLDAFVIVLDTCKHVCLSRVLINYLLTHLLTYYDFLLMICSKHRPISYRF